MQDFPWYFQATQLNELVLNDEYALCVHMYFTPFVSCVCILRLGLVQYPLYDKEGIGLCLFIMHVCVLCVCVSVHCVWVWVVCAHMCMTMYVCIYEYMHMYVCICMCVAMYVSMYVCVCMFVYIKYVCVSMLRVILWIQFVRI